MGSGRELEHYFATCAPGLEPVLQRELSLLQLARVERQTGGVAFRGRPADAWRANLCLRTAGRVLWRLARFEAPDGDRLHAGARAFPWEDLIGADATLAVEARTRDSALDHTLFCEQRVKDAVCDRLRDLQGDRPSVEKSDPTLRIFAHLYRDRCTLLADTSGAPLYKRGWRRRQSRAPLSETLAAAMLLDSDWDRRAPLIDPFCGSGTILIEAALLASGTPPGALRSGFAFERWRGHDAAAWKALREREGRRGELPRKLVLLGGDTDPRALEDARENLAVLGLEERVTLEATDARERAWKRGWNAVIVTNPPWGERVGRRDEVRELLAEFGQRLRAECAGYRLTMLLSGGELARALGIPTRRRRLLKSGPIDCELLHAEIASEDVSTPQA